VHGTTMSMSSSSSRRSRSLRKDHSSAKSSFLFCTAAIASSSFFCAYTLQLLAFFLNQHISDRESREPASGQARSEQAWRSFAGAGDVLTLELHISAHTVHVCTRMRMPSQSASSAGTVQTVQREQIRQGHWPGAARARRADRGHAALHQRLQGGRGGGVRAMIACSAAHAAAVTRSAS